MTTSSEAGDLALSGAAASTGDKPAQAPAVDGPSSPVVAPARSNIEPRRGGSSEPPAYAALDLGTNNCRLLVARPSRRGFKVIDAFSRIIRLGEGVTASGRLNDSAMTRTIQALQICATKIRRHKVARSRLVATEACRIASNGTEFLQRVEREQIGRASCRERV